jgi:hypothetical protein
VKARTRGTDVVRARLASWRQVAGSRPIVSAISSNLTPNTSWRRKAARSSGDRRSSANIRGSVTSSISSSAVSTTGSGSQGPM